jgi:hypothetical protein
MRSADPSLLFGAYCCVRRSFFLLPCDTTSFAAVRACARHVTRGDRSISSSHPLVRGKAIAKWFPTTTARSICSLAIRRPLIIGRFNYNATSHMSHRTIPLQRVSSTVMSPCRVDLSSTSHACSPSRSSRCSSIRECLRTASACFKYRQRGTSKIRRAGRPQIRAVCKALRPSDADKERASEPFMDLLLLIRAQQ